MKKQSKIINQYIEKICKQHNIKTILDLTCGTGSQVLWLTKRGYTVVGVDINEKMLTIAQKKAQQENLDIQFIHGDIRTIKAGTFDAVITIFNAIGHLTKDDFEKALQNIRAHLHDNGLYIFDIFNLTYLLTNDNITKLTIDRQTKSGDTIAREIQYSTISNDGVLASYDIYHEQKGTNEPTISHAFQTLQIYNAQQLQDILEKNGFNVVQQSDIDGSPFSEHKTEHLFTVAQKI